MLRYIFVIIYYALIAFSFTIQDTYNDLLKDNADYKIDIIINEDDYEMIAKNYMNNSDLNKIGDEFNEFNKLASKEYEKSLKAEESMVKNTKTYIETVTVWDLPVDIVHSTTARLLTKYERVINKRDIPKDELEYNYDQILNEYYDEAINDAKSVDTYHVKKSDNYRQGILDSLNELFLTKPEYINCSEKDTQGIGLKAIKCLWEYKKTQRYSPKIIRTCILKIIMIWFLIYLSIAIPLWCTRGWCCCCLFCKFFKPQRIIEEARRYVILNPPGFFRTKNGEVHYDATEREKESYEEFEHFIRTL